MNRSLVLTVWLLALCFLSGCGGGGGGGGGSGGGTVTSGQAAVLLTDAPADDLSSLAVTMTEVTLVSVAGGETQNLLATPARVELLGLSGRQALLQLAPLPVGSYDEVHASFDPASLAARDLAGNPVTIAVKRASAAALLAAPLVVTRDATARLRIDARLDDSLVRRGGQLELELHLGADDPRGDLDLDEPRGRVTGAQPAAGTFELDLLTHDDSVHAGGSATVTVDALSVLMNDDGVVFASVAAFFDALAIGDLVEVHGRLLPDGTLHATAVEIEHHRGVARIQGTIVALDLTANRLELQLRDIERGDDRVRSRIGDAAVIEVAWDDSTFLVRHDDRRDDHHHGDGGGQPGDDHGGGGEPGDDHGGGGGGGGHDDGNDHGPATEADLNVGQRVAITFLAFDGSPFLAHEIQIEDRSPDFEGRISDASGLPASVIVHLEPHDPAVMSGLVASSSTDVVVTLAGLTATFLDMHGEPAIDPSQLLADQRIHVRGTLSGTPQSPTIDATVIRVRPGELRGTIAGIDGAAHTAVIDVTRVDDSFGGPPLGSPASVSFAARARFDGDASSEAALVDLFLGKGSGEQIAVRARGIGDGTGGAKLFALESQVTRGR